MRRYVGSGKPYTAAHDRDAQPNSRSSRIRQRVLHHWLIFGPKMNSSMKMASNPPSSPIRAARSRIETGLALAAPAVGPCMATALSLAGLASVAASAGAGFGALPLGGEGPSFGADGPSLGAYAPGTVAGGPDTVADPRAVRCAGADPPERSDAAP